MADVRYVQRNENGQIIAHFACPQLGTATEALPEDHPDLIAYAERVDGPQSAGNG